MKNLLLFILLLFINFHGLIAQNNITILGTVLDEASNSPIPYATIALITNDTKKMFTAVTSIENGDFKITTDSSNFYMEIRFIGFDKKIITDFSTNNSIIDLGKIMMTGDNSLDEIEVRAERSSMEFRLDKRIFNVGKDISSSGMGALEVLNNVPSVNVDLEGVISLRGNSGVQILINGKPSVLTNEGSNALGSITADMIESIEVITNPSANYQAEGSAGILNIVIKKQEKKALNGSISVNTGYPNNHSIGLSLNQRTEKFNLFAQLGVGYRTRPTETQTTNHNFITNTIIQSIGSELKHENFYNVILGTDYYINPLNIITLSGNFAYEFENQPSELRFGIGTESDPFESGYKRIGTTTATNPKYQFDLQYAKEFKNNKDHTLLASTTGNFFGKVQKSEFLNELISGSTLPEGLQTKTDFYQAHYAFKLDYKNPIKKNITIEAGGLYEINGIANDYSIFDGHSELWTLNTNLSNNFEYDQKVLGLYGAGSFEGEKWSLKGGVRLENTALQTLLTTTNESHINNYTNLFPSAHLSYKMSKQYSFQAGYSKRISRPRMWDLNPFFNVNNTYNIRKGNPSLAPEFSDSYEITSIVILKKVSLNTSLYFSHTTDVVERVSYFINDVNTTTPENIGSRNQTGIEFNAKWKPTKWMSVNGDFNYGYFNRKGTFESQVFDFKGDKWMSKMNAKFKLPANFEIELSGNYRSKFNTIQGEVSGFISSNFGARKKIWKGKGVINFAVQDIFATRIREVTVLQPDYYLYSFGKRGRFFTLGFSYSFGKGEAMTYSGAKRH